MSITQSCSQFSGRHQAVTFGSAVRLQFTGDAHPDFVSIDALHRAAQQLDDGAYDSATFCEVQAAAGTSQAHG